MVFFKKIQNAERTLVKTRRRLAWRNHKEVIFLKIYVKKTNLKKKKYQKKN